VSLVEAGAWPPDTRFFVDIGNGDFLFGGMLRLVNALAAHAHIADFQGHVWPGVHDWPYWSKHTPDYLRFYTGVE
jgi:hypothetical protein